VIELELPFAVDDTDDLETLVSEIDRAVDASFLSDVAEALRLAKDAGPLAFDAPAATGS
jgi:hypothetical protein